MHLYSSVNNNESLSAPLQFREEAEMPDYDVDNSKNSK